MRLPNLCCDIWNLSQFARSPFRFSPRKAVGHLNLALYIMMPVPRLEIQCPAKGLCSFYLGSSCVHAWFGVELHVRVRCSSQQSLWIQSTWTWLKCSGDESRLCRGRVLGSEVLRPLSACFCLPVFQPLVFSSSSVAVFAFSPTVFLWLSTCILVCAACFLKLFPVSFSWWMCPCSFCIWIGLFAFLHCCGMTATDFERTNIPK